MMLDLHLQSENGRTGKITLNGELWLEVELPVQQEFLFQAIRAAAAAQGLDSHAFLVQRMPVTDVTPLFKQKKERKKREPVDISELLAELGL